MSDNVTVLLINFGGLGEHVAVQVPRQYEEQAGYLVYELAPHREEESS